MQGVKRKIQPSERTRKAFAAGGLRGGPAALTPELLARARAELDRPGAFDDSRRYETADAILSITALNAELHNHDLDHPNQPLTAEAQVIASGLEDVAGWLKVIAYQIALANERL